jgi:AAA+ ATPase superfamily predicted ATPase
MAFIGRQKELAIFNDRYDSDSAELVFLYGRRRIGKTEFLRRFAEGKNVLFFSANESGDNEQKERFKQSMMSFGFNGDPALLDNWENIFKNLMKLKFSGKTLVMIDEFQYLFMSNRSIPSILQNVWDEYLSKSNIMLVLCGSAMSFIENEVLGSKNPLYGRATSIFKMKELTFEEAAQFFPEYSLKDKIVSYAILGGIPFYLKQFSPSMSIGENIKQRVLSYDSVLYNEVEFMLKQELRETAIYNTLISAIALGSTKLNEISQKTMIDAAKVNVYLKNLIELNIVVKEYSVLDTIKKSANIQNGLYKISDNFFRFWYRYVYPNKNDIERGYTDMLAIDIAESAGTEYTSLCFEELCIEHIRKLNATRKLPFVAKQIGKIWAKRFEVDVGATDGRTILIGECKWTNSPVGTEVMDGLKEKIRTHRELADFEEHILYLFSRSGFTKMVKEEAKRNGAVLLDIEDMFNS